MNAQPAPTIPLATPAERPNAPVVIYDGHCRFCIQQVSRLARCDRSGRLAFLSLHDPSVAERYPDLSHDALMREMYVVDPRGGRHGGVQALRFLSRFLPTLWPVAPLLHVPFTTSLLRWGYQRIAERRYRLAGKVDCEDGACAVHFSRPSKSANTSASSSATPSK